MEPTLTLYDLACAAGHKPFSPYTWQVRLTLNYKRLPFKTIWLDFVDIKPRLKSIGASPTRFPLESEDGMYTVPVLVDTSNPASPTVISGSLAIAEYLDERYPERPIFPRGTKALQALYTTHLEEKVFGLLVPILIPKTLSFISERDKGYFRETRERWLGTKLEDICPTEAKSNELLEKLKEEFDVLAKLLDENGEGTVLVLGDQVSRADFVLIGLFAWMRTLDPTSWEKVKTWNEGKWENLWRRSEDWRLNDA